MGLWKFVSRLFGGPTQQALGVGTKAPPFSLKDIDGKRYTLAEAMEQGPVLLAFFKESCPVCQFTFPFLDRLRQATRDKNKLQIWGISQNNTQDTRAFARSYRCTFPMLLDEDGYPVSNQYGLTNVPTLFLVSPDGTIQVSSVGFSRRDIEAVAAEFGRLQGESIVVFQPGEKVPDYKPG